MFSHAIDHDVLAFNESLGVSYTVIDQYSAF